MGRTEKIIKTMYFCCSCFLAFISQSHTLIDAVYHINIQKLFYWFSNKYYDILISALPGGGGFKKVGTYQTFLCLPGHLKEVGHLFVSLRYVVIFLIGVFLVGSSYRS